MIKVFNVNMILLKLLLFLYLKGYLADESEANETRSNVQLWRAEGHLDKVVLETFEQRAHFTEDIWRRNNRTIDFLLFDEETKNFAAFLNAYNVSHRVLIANVTTNVDEAILAKFPPSNVTDPDSDNYSYSDSSSD